MLNKIIQSIFCVLGICIFLTTNAQGLQTIDENTNAWLMYFGDHQLTKKLGIHTEAQVRRADILENWQQLLLRGGVNCSFSKSAMATLGYAYVQTFPYGDFPAIEAFPEHRVYEQLQFKNKEGRLGLLHRYRLEQRWVTSPLNNSAIYSNRARYFLKATLPLTKNPDAVSGLYLAAYDEIFINFGKNVQRNVFDQNRLYFALGYKINKSAAIEAGYLKQIIHKQVTIRGGSSIFEHNHTLQLGITYNIDLSEKD